MADLTVQQENLLREMVSARVSKLKRSSGYEYTGCCPDPSHDDVKPSWGINMRLGLHKCHSCGFSGNSVTLAKFWNQDPSPFYSTEYQNGSGNIAEKVPVVVASVDKQPNNTEKQPSNPLSYDKVEDWDLVPLPDEKMRKNWSSEAVSELRVHWSKKYRGLAFPVLDLDYEFIGCYLHKPEIGNTRFTVGVRSQVYPQFLLKNYSPLKPLIVVEGLPDVVTARSWGFQAVSGTAGAGSVPRDLSAYEPWNHSATASLNESNVWSVSNPVIIAFDFDKQGREGAGKLAKALKKKFPNMVVLVCDWRKINDQV